MRAIPHTLRDHECTSSATAPWSTAICIPRHRWGQQPTAIVVFPNHMSREPLNQTRAPLLSPPFLLHLSRLPREGSFPCYSCLPRFRCCCGSTTLEASFAQCVFPLGLCPAASNMDDAHTMPTQTAGNLTLVPFAHIGCGEITQNTERGSPSSSTSVWGGKLVKQREAREQPNKRQRNCTNLGTTAFFHGPPPSMFFSVRYASSFASHISTVGEKKLKGGVRWSIDPRSRTTMALPVQP